MGRYCYLTLSLVFYSNATINVDKFILKYLHCRVDVLKGLVFQEVNFYVFIITETSTKLSRRAKLKEYLKTFRYKTKGIMYLQ